MMTRCAGAGEDLRLLMARVKYKSTPLRRPGAALSRYGSAYELYVRVDEQIAR